MKEKHVVRLLQSDICMCYGEQVGGRDDEKWYKGPRDRLTCSTGSVDTAWEGQWIATTCFVQSEALHHFLWEMLFHILQGCQSHGSENCLRVDPWPKKGQSESFMELIWVLDMRLCSDKRRELARVMFLLLQRKELENGKRNSWGAWSLLEHPPRVQGSWIQSPVPPWVVRIQSPSTHKVEQKNGSSWPSLLVIHSKCKVSLSCRKHCLIINK